MKQIFLTIMIITLFWQNIFASIDELSKEEKEYLKNNPIITIGYSNDFPPNYIDDGNTVKGIIPDTYKIISKKYGVEFRYVTNNWMQIIQDIKDAKIDVIPIMNKKIAQENKLLISYERSVHRFKVYAKKGKRYNINSIEDLFGLKIAYTKNLLVLNKFLHNYKDRCQLIESATPYESLQKVSNEKADLAILLNISGDYTLSNTPLKGLEPIFNLKKLQPITVTAIRPDSPILASIIEKMNHSVALSDKLEIINKWTQNNINHKTKNKDILNKQEKEFLKNKTFNIYYTETGWHPFIFKENGIMEGIGVDIWEQLIKDIDIKYNYVTEESFNKILELSKKDPLSLHPSTSLTKEKEKYASFTKPYTSFPVAIATNEDEDFILDFKELEGKSIAVGKNYSAHNLLKNNYPKIKFIPTQNTQEALKLLSSGKVFAAADILPVLNYEINRHNFTDIKISGTSKFNFDVRIMVNKQNQELIPILNKLIDNISKDKKQNILNKWLHSTKNTRIDYTPAYWVSFIFLIIIFFMIYRHKILEKQKIEIEKEVENSTIELKKLNILHEETQRLAKIATMKKDLLNGSYWVSKEFYNIYEFSKSYEITTELIMSRIDDTDKVKLINFFKKNERYNNMPSNEDNIIIKLLFPKQRIKYIEIHLSYIFDQNHQAIERQATIQDITEKILAKEEKERQEAILIQQNKLAAMGEMIGAIAHQWRQPLNELGIRIQKIKYKYAKNEIDDKYIDKFVKDNKKTISFMSKTIDDFRNFFRIDKEKRDFHIKNAIDDVLNILSAQLKNHYIDVNLDGEDFILHGYQSEFQQVLINIIANSKDAFILNNTKEPKIDIIIKQNSIVINDNAGGIPKDVIDRVFEPYFTTKEQGSGTGMGLYMSKMIIEDNMGGLLTIENYANGISVSIVLKGDI